MGKQEKSMEFMSLRSKCEFMSLRSKCESIMWFPHDFGNYYSGHMQNHWKILQKLHTEFQGKHYDNLKIYKNVAQFGVMIT